MIVINTLATVVMIDKNTPVPVVMIDQNTPATVIVRDGHGGGWSRKINAWHLYTLMVYL